MALTVEVHLPASEIGERGGGHGVGRGAMMVWPKSWRGGRGEGEGSGLLLPLPWAEGEE